MPTNLDIDSNKLGRTLSVAHDQLRKLHGKLRELSLENLVPLLVRLLIDLDHFSVLRRCRSTISKDQDRIVCRHVPFDADRVEAAVNSVRKRGLRNSSAS